MSAIGSRVPPRRVGHKGAAHLAPGNTLASFDAAVQAGVDMIEFDVLSEHPDGSGRLLLAHDYGALAIAAAPLTLEQGLAHLASGAYAGIELDVDVKLPGYGERVVRALRESGLIGRALVSSTYPEDLDAMRAIEPALRVGWSLPRARRSARVAAAPCSRGAASGALRRDHGPLASGHRRARARRRGGRWGAVRVDRRRRRADGPHERARGRRDHHQRSAPVCSATVSLRARAVRRSRR
jgi:glycerophosphoryl diester phosphodiesterase